MNKKEYKIIELEIIEFTNADVITESDEIQGDG